MKILKEVLLSLFVLMPYVVLAFLFDIAFDNTNIEKWIGLGLLIFGLLCLVLLLLLPDKKEKEDDKH